MLRADVVGNRRGQKNTSHCEGGIRGNRGTIEGEPSRISMCHCLECQRRTGAVISNQARFRREQVTFAGKAMAWMRTAESGNALTFHFCPTCVLLRGYFTEKIAGPKKSRGENRRTLSHEEI